MKNLVLLALSALSFGAFATDFTVKSEVSDTDFDWTLGSNYVGDPENGPQNGDKIIIPDGVTAKLPEAATSSKSLFANLDFEVQAGGTLLVYCPDDKRHYSYCPHDYRRGDGREYAGEAQGFLYHEVLHV